MFKKLVIGEFGNTFFKSLGITESISSTCHQSVDNVVTKRDIYAKLGIDYSDNMPDIAILCNLGNMYDIRNPDRKVVETNVLMLMCHNIDILLIDNIWFTNGKPESHRSNEAFKFASLFNKSLPETIIQYSICRANGGCTYIDIVKCNCPKYGAPYLDDFNHSSLTQDTEIKGVYIRLFVCKIKILISDFTKYYEIKRMKELADHDLLPKYNALQSKIMEFFGIEDQSSTINELREQLGVSQQKNIEYEATIEKISNAMGVFPLSIKSITK